MKDDVQDLTKLGSETKYEYSLPAKHMLETFPNKYPHINYHINFETDEFTSLCPKTGQPDYGTIHIEYIPNEYCIESKSLKLYIFAYRNSQAFMETLTNQIADDLFEACMPIWLQVEGTFNARGGIIIKVKTERYGDE